MKRVRPAPMGRAFRIQKRTAHLTVRVSERPLKIAAVDTTAPKGRSAKAEAGSGEARACAEAGCAEGEGDGDGEEKQEVESRK